jgi:hypothetical protein
MRSKYILLVMGLALLSQSIVRAAELERPYSLSSKFGISVSITPKEGRYTVSVNGRPWFGPGLVSVLVNGQWYRSAGSMLSGIADDREDARKLLLDDVRTGSNTDTLGAYEFFDLYWTLPELRVEFTTGFRLYRDNPFLVFVQRFPKGFNRYASGNWTVPSVIFPQFVPDLGGETDLFSWVSGGMGTHRFGYGDAASVVGTVDFLLLSKQNYPTVILSPFNNFMVATQQNTPSTRRTIGAAQIINCGIEGLVDELPVGFEHQHIMVASNGVNRAIKIWGQALLDRSGKKIPSKYQDDTLKHLVYDDDAGAYYFMHDFKEDGYKSYEDIVLGLEEEAKKNGLRIGTYAVLDLWQLRYHEGLLEPRDDLFPHGIRWLHERLGKPLQCYVAWQPNGGPYRKSYPYFETPDGSWKNITDALSMGDVFYSEDYWRYTAEKLASWGCICLQQDYLSMYHGQKEMMSGLSKMDTYLKNMAKALRNKGLSMQYCMQLPRNVMESTENPTLISLQGSWDHHVGMTEVDKQHDDESDPYTWRHLIFASAFYGAVGIWPSRDNIQTIADPNAYEDTLVANLLGGSIQLGHRIGECNFDLLRKTYREGDELLLKPDRPITPLDRCYVEGGVIGYTESTISGKRWFYVLSLPAAGYLRSFSLSDLGVEGRAAVYNYDTRSVFLTDATSPIYLRREAKHEYFIVAPLLENGMAVIGDVSKFVTMADMRVPTVETLDKSVRVGVISNESKNPIVTGYSARRPTGIEAGSAKLDELSSLDRLETARSGWFWDYQTKLWHAKIDFAGAPTMETRSFQVY